MNTCSDQLRAELTANNIEMNRLTERNDAILSTLRERGLEPVRVRDDVKCKVRFVVDKPLSDEQLRAGDWYCTEVDADVIQLLKDRGISFITEVFKQTNPSLTRRVFCVIIGNK